MTAKKRLPIENSAASGRTLEQDLQRLEQIVDALEQGEIPLEQAMKMYEEGIALSKACMEKLQEAELKIRTLSKDINGKLQLSDD
ncbi:MAG: exodeoxyribonuclease VII small subunit [Bacteroidota bacterium]